MRESLQLSLRSLVASKLVIDHWLLVHGLLIIILLWQGDAKLVQRVSKLVISSNIQLLMVLILINFDGKQVVLAVV